MKKKNVLWLILNLTFLIVFNVLFFLSDKSSDVEHNVLIWISYGFIHFAYLMLLITSKLIRRGKSSAVFGFSLYYISAIYFLIEFVIGITFILVSPESYNIALLVQICIAGLYVIMLVSHMLSNEYTADAEEKQRYQIAYVKDASVKLKVLLENISDKETKKKVERLYDTLYSSPVKSHPNLMEIEHHILTSINELESAVAIGKKESIISLVNSLLLSINKRNNSIQQKNR